MRVIAGTARRRNLVCPSGKHTRPTTDRIKETLFNILQQRVPDCRFLDLYSGSGGIGIEALSRGAREAVFVEKDKEALACIKTNIKNTGFEDRSRVMAMDVMQALRRLGKAGAFDLIFLDPPYEKGYEEQVITYLTESDLVRQDTWIILETTLFHAQELFEGKYLIDNEKFTLERVKEYKSNAHVIYRILRE